MKPLPKRIKHAIATSRLTAEGCILPLEYLSPNLSYEGKSHRVIKIIYCVANKISPLKIDGTQTVRQICGNSECLNSEHLILTQAGPREAAIKKWREDNE